ncbi:MAG: hypothetical protein K8R56_04195, partial [Candidatus Eisenbacteria bacterium]|nr:hypothetical protein [Candidatus Eisenbacteria bacterium]
TVIDLFYARGMRLTATARVPAGFSWMNDRRTKPLQAAFTDALAWLHRLLGLDLAKDANFVLTFEKVGEAGYRKVTHVCRECGEHSVVSGADSATWTCPYCGKPNPFGRAR